MNARLHSLDGLRAIAACLVVAHHMGIASLSMQWRDQGHPFAANLLAGFTGSGVELFFTLSAIVLTRPYISGERKLKLGTYATRRIERLLPPFFAAWLVAGLVIYASTAFPTWQTVSSGAPAFTLRDWLSQIGIVYWGPHPFNVTWWSLAVEVAFYILVPVFIIIFTQLYGRTRRIGALYASTIVAAVLAAAFWSSRPPILYSLVAYAPCFCAGLILAAHKLSRAVSMSFVFGGLLWIPFACAWPWLNVHVGWSLLYFGVVAIAMNRTSWLCTRLSSYGFVWLGERSYSLFLIHNSMIVLSYQAASSVLPRGMAYFGVSRSAALVLTAVATVLVFHLVERRFAHNLSTSDDMLPRWRLDVEPRAISSAVVR